MTGKKLEHRMAEATGEQTDSMMVDLRDMRLVTLLDYLK